MWLCIHLFNAHFSLSYFANDWLLTVYFTFILDQGNDVRQKWIQAVFLSSKWAMKQWRQLPTSTMHLAQKLLTNVQYSGGSRRFAKDMRALKMKSAVAGHWKLTANNWEDHWSWSAYNYTRSCWRTQLWPFYDCSAFKANWKGEKAWKVGASWADWK